MLRFCANLSMLFTELPLRARFAAARLAGFDAVEMLFPYGHDPDMLRSELAVNGLRQVLINLPPGDWEAGERGLAALPGREAEFEEALATALDYAEALDCRLLHVMSGVLPGDADPDRCMATLAGNLARVAPVAAARGVTLLIEPINRRDMPGYALDRTAAARDVIDRVGAGNVALQFDVYHRQVSEGDVVTALRGHMDIIRHVQIANAPGRRAPDLGEIDYGFVFGALAEAGYAGWIGCEYHPHGATPDSLAWLENYRRTGRLTAH